MAEAFFDLIGRPHGQYVLPLALVQYIGYLGLPPLEVICQSPLFSTYFDSEGKYGPLDSSGYFLRMPFLTLSETGNWISEPLVSSTI